MLPDVEDPKKLIEWFTDGLTGDTETNCTISNSRNCKLYNYIVIVIVLPVVMTGNNGIGRGV